MSRSPRDNHEEVRFSSWESRAEWWSARVAMWVGLAATVPLGGCSLLFVDGPPKTYQPSWQIQCTTSNALPVIDVLLAGFQAYRTGAALSRSDSDYRGAALSRSADITAGVTLFALTAISAGVGFSRVSDCKAAIGDKDLMERRREERRRRRQADRIDPNAHPSLVSPGPVPVPTGPTGGAARPVSPTADEPKPAASQPIQQQTDED